MYKKLHKSITIKPKIKTVSKFDFTLPCKPLHTVSFGEPLKAVRLSVLAASFIFI
jgi:hypothetical protein